MSVNEGFINLSTYLGVGIYCMLHLLLDPRIEGVGSFQKKWCFTEFRHGGWWLGWLMSVEDWIPRTWGWRSIWREVRPTDLFWVLLRRKWQETVVTGRGCVKISKGFYMYMEDRLRDPQIVGSRIDEEGLSQSYQRGRSLKTLGSSTSGARAGREAISFASELLASLPPSLAWGIPGDTWP